jgi:two-component system, NtrC family, sensor histidine kinase PilS
VEQPPADPLTVPSSAGPGSPEHFWRSLLLFDGYRLLTAGIFLAATALFSNALVFGSRDPRVFLFAAAGYAAFSLASFATIHARRPGFEFQLGVQVGGDVAFITLLSHASGGIQSGVALLLLPSIAAAGLISRGRLSLFFAALASIATLLEQTYSMLRNDGVLSQYVQAGLLSIGYFATAWVAHTLARYALVSERLARQRGVDLANLSQVNQLIIQDMHDGVVVVDGQGRVRQRNAQAERLLGLNQGMTGENPMLGDCSSVVAERYDAWRTHAATEFDLLRVPKTNRLLRTRFVSVDEERGSGAVIILEDMSRVQAQAQQLKLAALGRLTANIAHEIRNPLSAISHASELMQEEEPASPTQKRLARIIRDNTSRLDRLVQEVLQLNRRDRVAQERFHAGEFLRSFADGFAQSEHIPRAALALSYDGEPRVCFDRAHLNQVLWNVCRNAWRHSGKQDGSIRLRVSAGATPNTTVIDVIDDGPGIPEGLRAQVFEPFFTTVSSGTGLGLYISREMCDANGATLDCIETASGAHFRITCRRDHVKAQRASDALRI